MSCQSLRIQLTEIKEGMQGLDTAIQQFLTDPEAYNTYPGVSKKLAELAELRNKFVKEYRDSAVDLMYSFFGGDDDIYSKEEVKSFLEFEEDGRLAIVGKFWGDIPRLSVKDYLPSIIRKTEGDVEITTTGVESADHLEEARNLFTKSEPNKPALLSSLKRLRRVGALKLINTNVQFLESLESASFLDVEGHNAFQGAPNLRGLDSLHIGDVHIESFRKAFPALEQVQYGPTMRIGGRLLGRRAQVAIIVNNQKLKEEVEKLKADGDIIIGGEVAILGQAHI